MDIELKELSNIYLQTISEEEDGAAGEGQNPQQSVDVGSHAKSIRYQARRDNVPLPKAFNDYVAKNQLSGAERTALRQKLGFMEEVEQIDEFIGTALAGTKGAIEAKPKDRLRKSVGSGAGYAVGAKGGEMAGKAIGGAVGQAVGHGTVPFVGGAIGKEVGKVVGKVAGGVTGGVMGSKVGNKLAGESKPKKTMEEVEVLGEKKGCNHSHKGEECPVHGKKECSMKEEDDYKSRDKIMKKAKPLHKHLYKNLHKGDTEGDVNESRYFSWREELRELVDVTSSKPKTDKKSGEKISEKKVKNKIVINPPQGMTEAIEELGGQILEMVEIEEEIGSTGLNPETKKQLAAKEQMMRKQQLIARQRLQMQKQGKIPVGHMEGLSVDDQMKISQEYNRKSPEEKKAANKKALGTIKKVKREKDTRTDDQKMTDATGPRPGSRYRGD